MERVQLGQLSVRVTPRGDDELAQLAVGFNRMVEECEQNLKRSVERQKELNDTRIRMMQAQLNPHFLYNTLDSMKWMGVKLMARRRWRRSRRIWRRFCGQAYPARNS